MKKERIETLVDSFVDANGDTHHFVIAAVSEVLPTEDEYGCISHEVVRYDDELGSEFVDCVVKRVSLGFAFCNPEDEFNEELGKTIALCIMGRKS